MSVNFKSPLTSANTNSAFVSRTQDTSMIGQLDNQNATDSSSTTTGAIKTSGGLGVAKKAHINQVFVNSLAGSKVLISSSTKEILESTVTDSELTELSGITGNVQAQIDAKANDSAVVHNTGNETVAGIKTFTDDTNFGGNVVITGDLTVNGTTTTINTETLDVEDKNVTINKGGSDATAEGAGLSVDRTATDGSLVYQNSLASRWKAGDLGSESEVITASTTQILTGEKTVYDLNINANLTISQTVDSTTTGSNATVPTPTGTIRLTNSSLVSIASIDDVKNGKVVILTNRTSSAVEIKNNAGSPAGLGVNTGTGEDFTLENNSSVFLSYDSIAQRWFLLGGTGSKSSVGYQEVPAGPINGSNTNFGPLTFAPSNNDSLVVFLDGIALQNTEWSLVGLSITLNVAPTTGQSLYVFYLTGGTPITPPAPSGVLKTEFRTITSGEELAKSLTLADTPATPGYVLVDVIGGTAQEFNVDYTIVSNSFQWNGYGLDGVLAAGDKIRFCYLT